MKPNRNDSVGQQSAAEDALCKALTSLDSVEDCRNFLRDLCTPAELQALVDRWQVVELLEQGRTYRKIHDPTGVSVTTSNRESPMNTRIARRRIPARSSAAASRVNSG